MDELRNHLAVLAECQRPTVDVQDAGDAVSVRVVWKHGGLLAVVVEVAAVRAVQPHVRRGAVAVIAHRPLAHAYACPFIAAVLLHDVKLHQHITSKYERRSKSLQTDTVNRDICTSYSVTST